MSAKKREIMDEAPGHLENKPDELFIQRLSEVLQEPEMQKIIEQSLARVLDRPDVQEAIAQLVRESLTSEELEELKTRYQAGELENFPAPMIGS